MLPDAWPAKTNLWFWLVVATAVATASLFFFAPNQSIGSDPRYTLLVSRAVLADGTIRLDSQLPIEERQNYRITEINGHFYYSFPYGTSLIVTPFVWGAEKIGFDVRQFPDEIQVQKWLLAGTGALLVFLCWAVLNAYLSPALSWLFTIALVWGSVLASTLGSALWNLNLSVLCILAAVWLLARHHAGKSATTRPILLGIFLVLGFLCRPTTAVFIALACLYLIIYSRRELWLAAGTALLGLFIFMAYNQAVMDTPLPPYYLPQRLESQTPFTWALWGLLFSPSRGLLVFSPITAYFLAMALVSGTRGQRTTRQIIGLLLLWFAMHLVVIARFDHWWGGFSYGPRLLTDAMPAVVWVTAVSWQNHSMSRSPVQQVLHTSLWAVLAIFSIYVNTFTGLYNPAAHVWNGGSLPPNIDRAPQYLFDWRYPQFLATESQLCQKHNDYFAQLYDQKAYHLSNQLSGHTAKAVDSTVLSNLSLFPPWYESEVTDNAQFGSGPLSPYQVYLPLVGKISPIYFLPKGWYNLAGGRLQAACAPATFIVGPVDDALAARFWQLDIGLDTAASQPVWIYVNSQPVGMLNLREEQESYELTIPANIFAAREQNEIKIFPAHGVSQASGQVWLAPPIYFKQLTLTAVDR